MKIVNILVSSFAFLALAACGSAASAEEIFEGQTHTEIYWSDGDSGRLSGLKFRLNSIDAPETAYRKIGKSAECDKEIELGYLSKEFMLGLTKGQTVTVDRFYELDRWGRAVVDLSVNGSDIAQSGMVSGALRSWEHKKGRALEKRPDWCQGFRAEKAK